MSLKCYSDWQLGAIQNDLTQLTLRFTEDSAKQLVNSLQLTIICKIGLLSEEYLILLIENEFESAYVYKYMLMYINILYIFFVVRYFNNLFLNLYLFL